MTAEGDDDITVESRLTKLEQIPAVARDAVDSDISALTGETRESKAKTYAAEETKAVAAHHIRTIEKMKTNPKSADDKFAAMGKNLEDANNR